MLFVPHVLCVREHFKISIDKRKRWNIHSYNKVTNYVRSFTSQRYKYIDFDWNSYEYNRTLFNLPFIEYIIALCVTNKARNQIILTCIELNWIRIYNWIYWTHRSEHDTIILRVCGCMRACLLVHLKRMKLHSTDCIKFDWIQEISHRN